jgi:mannose-6-phosphate isomerase-like protein (cupin superfamily)
VLGGDDAGGGVIWAPQVIEDAKAHGLVLGANGKLYDSKKGESLPAGVKPMPLLSEEELKAFPEVSVEDVVPGHVARYWDLMALAGTKPAKVIGEHAMLRDKPGFEVELLTRGSIPETPYATPRHEVLMVMRGHWKLNWEGGETTLAPGDTCAVPPNLKHSLAPSMTGEASLYRVMNTDDRAGPTWKGH